MPHILITNLSKQFANGDWLYKDLNFSFQSGVIGLVGKNGVGKSTLLKSIVEDDNKAISRVGLLYYFSQIDSIDDTSIAHFLGIADKLSALSRIESGVCDVNDFELLCDDWEVKARAEHQLKSLGIDCDVWQSCQSLSGGQMAKLKLHIGFNSDAEILLLDEPSNHLDGNAKTWLIDQLRCFSGLVIVATHDEDLLEHVDSICQLNNEGLTCYQGNYSTYRRQYEQELAARVCRLNDATKQRERLKEIAQQTQQRNARSARHGKQLVRSGSQSKMLMDAKADKASKANKAVVHAQHQRMQRLELSIDEISASIPVDKAQALYLNQNQSAKSKLLVQIDNWRCQYNEGVPLTGVIYGQNRCRLLGENGVGKSSLLKDILTAKVTEVTNIKVNCEVTYLDQYFSWLPPQETVINAFMLLSCGVSIAEARTMLAGLNFKKDAVYLRVEQLSGGEKMKLALLCASYRKSNVLLLLDEPDNHLDIDSKAILAKTLKHYRGAFILVSHNEHFIKQVGINKLMQL